MPLLGCIAADAPAHVLARCRTKQLVSVHPGALHATDIDTPEKGRADGIRFAGIAASIDTSG